MATVPSSISGSPRGITNTLSGFVIESETITETPVQEDFDDQTGARADEQVYDTRYDLRLTVYGANSESDITDIVEYFSSSDTKQGKKIVYATKNWKVDSCEEAGSYELIADYTVRVRLLGFRVEITVLAGTWTDGASVPQSLWGVCGTPMDPPRVAAAVVHDWLYSAQALSRADADWIYAQIQAQAGIAYWRILIEYLALRLCRIVYLTPLD